MSTTLNYGRMSGDQWVDVLLAHPELAEHCDWSKLQGSHWSSLLSARPQFADFCSWEKLSRDERMLGHYSCWPDLLVWQPQFADKCDWDSIEADGWATLLRKRPEFADKCDWSKFDKGVNAGSALGRILASQPQLESACDWRALSGSCMADLLKRNPEYAGHCDFSGLSVEDWVGSDVVGGGLLEYQPRFADKCCCWEQFTIDQWVALLKAQPSLANRCDKLFAIDAKDWVEMLGRQPSLVDCFSDWDKISADDWTELIVKHPEFGKRCNAWEQFSLDNWYVLLKNDPLLFGKCDKWKDLNCNAYAWKKLVEVQPQLADFRNAMKKGEGVTLYRISINGDVPPDANECVSHETVESLADLLGPGKANVFSKFEGADWYHLLERRPEFAVKADLRTMDDMYWDRLLKEQPALEKYRPPIETRRFSSFDGTSWAKVLSEHPEYEQRCVWSKIHRADDWVVLLSAQPQFADRCPWDNFGGEPLARLIAACPKLYSKCRKEYIDGEGWVRILKQHPDFAKKYKTLAPKMWLRDKCVVWHSFPDLCDADFSSFESGQIVYVLRFCPEYAGKCDLSKIDGSTWANLLDGGWGGVLDGERWKIHKESYTYEKHPGLAPLCAWEKIPADKVCGLIKDYPQYADRMDLSQCPAGQILDAVFTWTHEGDHDNGDRNEKLYSSLIERIDLSTLDGWNWALLIAHHPEYADKCDWSKLDGWDWSHLLRERPEFADRCEWDLLDNRGWTWLLEGRLEFAYMCSFDKLDGGNWVNLLIAQPKLSSYCTWSKLNDWDDLVPRNWEKLLVERPEFIDKCDISRLGTRNWSAILKKQPQLADKCDKWSEFNDSSEGGELSSLLACHPQFADRYEQLPCSGGRALAGLLQVHPELSVKCQAVFADAQSFCGYEWASLLSTPGILNRLRVEAIEVVKAEKPGQTAKKPAKKVKKASAAKARTKESKSARKEGVGDERTRR